MNPAFLMLLHHASIWATQYGLLSSQTIRLNHIQNIAATSYNPNKTKVTHFTYSMILALIDLDNLCFADRQTEIHSSAFAIMYIALTRARR